MNGLARVQARIAEIEATFARPSARSGSFDAALETAVATSDDPVTTIVAGLAEDLSEQVAANTAELRLLETYDPTGSSLTPADGAWIRALPEAGLTHAGAIADAARANGLEPELLAAVVWQESDFDADAVSSAGAIGLGQLMPATAAELGVDPTDPLDNLAGAATYLSQLRDRFDGDLDLALAAYNAGPTAVESAGGVPSDGVRGYVDGVLAHLRDLESASAVGETARAAAASAVLSSSLLHTSMTTGPSSVLTTPDRGAVASRYLELDR